MANINQIEKNEINTNQPVITKADLKLPEEQFGRQSPKSDMASYLGLMLSALIIILVLLLGGLYLWGVTDGPFSKNSLPVSTEQIPANDNL